LPMPMGKLSPNADQPGDFLVVGLFIDSKYWRQSWMALSSKVAPS
jgi:hypothetical protein